MDSRNEKTAGPEHVSSGAFQRLEERLHYQSALLASMPDALITTDLQHRIQYWNAAAQALYGWTAEEVLGRKIGECVPDEYSQSTRRKILNQVVKRGYWKGEIYQYCRDGTKVPVFSAISKLNDRQGQLTGYIIVNHAIIKRKTVEDALQKTRDDLAVLYEVSAVASRALDLDTLLSESLSRTLRGMQAEAGAIFLREEAESVSVGPALHLSAWQGIPEKDLAEFSSILLAEAGLMAWALEQQKPLLIPGASDDPRVPAALRGRDARSFLLAPLHAGGETLGIILVVRIRDNPFTPEEVALLDSIADQVAISIRNDRLRKQTVVLEERQKLARELHDSIAQSLYGLVNLAEAGQAQLEAGETNLLTHTLVRVTETGRQVIKEMRRYIHQLRPSVLKEEGLIAALQLRLDAVEGRSGVQTHLFADEDLDLPFPVEEAFYWIAQEALNNILKHTNARTITITIGRRGKEMVLEVVDDGRGFDPQTVDHCGMGLKNMRDRTEELGGRMSIDSRPGEGTRIRVALKI
jgi:PAS domain S-box-containing protein